MQIISFHNKFIIRLYIFRALYSQHLEVKILLHRTGIITNVGGRPVHRLREDCARDGYLQL